MKTTGAIWNEYLASWPEGQWFDESDETVNGQSSDDFLEIPANAIVQFSEGIVFKDESDDDGVSLASHFRAWLKGRDSVTLFITVNKDQESALRDFVKGIKGKVA